MLYKIGEVSKIMKISDQMIRYYEKAGIIHPIRTGDGNYRMYSAMDVFFIYEAMKYKEWNISIKDIHNIINNNYFDSMVNKLDDFSLYLQESIAKQQMLLKRINTIKQNLEICRYNVGNYWVEKTPKRYAYFSISGQGDNYELTTMNPYIEEIVFGKDTISYFDVLVSFSKQDQEWSYSIEDYYHENLHIKDTDNYSVIEEGTCLCTIIDMGPVGNFSYSVIDDIKQYAKEKNYIIDGTIYGIILGRGDDKGFTRMMKLFMPIKTL